MKAGVLLLFISSALYGQIEINFENNKSLINVFSNDTNRWEYSGKDQISGSYSLHHCFDNSSSAEDYIFWPFNNLPNTNDTIIWNFKIKYTYTPSSSNHWTFYLISDNHELYSNSFDGHAIIFGADFAGSDDSLKIFYLNKNKFFIINTTKTNLENEIGINPVEFQIIKLPDNEWTIKKRLINEKEWNIIGNFNFDINFNPYFWGLAYKYSSTQDRKLWLDDACIKYKYNNNHFFFIDTVFIKSPNELIIEFSDVIDSKSVSEKNFYLKNYIIEKYSVDCNKILLNLNDSLDENVYFDLNVKGIKNFAGNIVDTTVIIINSVIKQFDILITEIMSDPDPSVSLPPYEYIELYNRSNSPHNLENCIIQSNSYYITLPSLVIQPNEYVIVTNVNAKGLFDKYCKSIYNINYTYFLNNSTGTVLLKDKDKRLISFVKYDYAWHDNIYKRDGGWALEMIDTNNPCNGSNNWTSSINSRGGTPGEKNSVERQNADIVKPYIERILIPDDTTIIVQFNETIDSTCINDSFIFYPKNTIKSIVFLDLIYSKVKISLSDKLNKDLKYYLKINDKICDCVKNAADTSTIYFGLPYVPDTSDIVINEILFDAYPNGAEFVEIYNRSEHIMDIGQVTLTLIDSITDNVIQYCNIAEKGTLFYSGEYLAITNNYKGLANFYRTIGSGIIENKDFLSLPDKSGYVGLINLSGKIIDKIKYENNMHFTLIRNTEGVSLEKINPHLSGMNTNNWHSASESAGYATPAVKNSQYMQISELHKPSEVTIYPEIFSPNNDGTDDILFIEISPNDNNYVANINIFNSSGILIKRLINQSYCGTKEIFTWDGTSDDNKGLSTGIYIISIKLFNNRGKNEQINKTCVLK